MSENPTDTNQASEDELQYEPRSSGKSFRAWLQFMHLSRTGKSIAYRTPEGDICSPAYVKELIRTEKLKLSISQNGGRAMSKDTTDLKLKIEHYLVSTQQDGAGIAMGRRSADGSLYKSRIDEFTEAIMSEIDQLISNREKLLLDRVEKEVLNDVEVRADQTDVIDDIEDWLQGGGIPPSYDYGRIHVLANERHKVLRRKLATLRKELDGGQE